MRLSAIKSQYPVKTANDIGYIGAKNTPVNMDFIDHNEFEVAQEVHPGSVMR
ncbi:hypothetical protein SDC9_101876 [bioreactor metagenome]|uniref:Uncharacterized protein n=1 Tax=bioreactor metagenome TaxID=1076179 RepID=A0A645AS01_9ZZZZ